MEKEVPKYYEAFGEKLEIRDDLRKLLDYPEERKITLDPENLSPEVQKILELYERAHTLTKGLKLTLTNYQIDNLDEEERKFIENYHAGKPENPHFAYTQELAKLQKNCAEKNLNLAQVRAELRAITDEVKQIKIASEQKQSQERIGRFALIKLLEETDLDFAIVEGVEQLDEKSLKRTFLRKYNGYVDDGLLQSAEKLYQHLKEHATDQPADPLLAKLKQIRDNTPPSTPEGVQELARMNSAERKNYFDATELKEAFDFVLQGYEQYYREKFGTELPEDYHYEAVILENAPNISIDHKTRQAKIPHCRIENPERILELMTHEIEGHVAQRLNTKKYNIGGKMGTNDATLVEGWANFLAAKNMKEILGKGDEIKEIYPYRVMAIRLAEEGKDFTQIFDYFYHKHSELLQARGIAPEKISAQAENVAWGIAYRVLRGHIDSANTEAYANGKDRAYLEGNLMMRQLEALGLTQLNQNFRLATKAPALVNRLNLTEKNMDFPFLNLSAKYFREKILPRIN